METFSTLNVYKDILDLDVLKWTLNSVYVADFQSKRQAFMKSQR